ncbi:hypothetical protein AK812_SmicGene4219 [Symbiodinium microadriaticum]|uniref:Uncharacterized protein n=1 Tax=Symbiodinium microadriaticum TaxID=2951 RepID=A0A1Q9EWY9_SYMMI|nr:hypothetical protein AK812_SmicGene4219 [Symbiodinium microadriaticum]CAE7650975.1 unnamed protein product [Symbiodinium microadriaticum]CAE7944264.1 unnamed protein product [Symbiodinium sp. KB8]
MRKWRRYLQRAEDVGIAARDTWVLLGGIEKLTARVLEATADVKDRAALTKNELQLHSRPDYNGELRSQSAIWAELQTTAPMRGTTTLPSTGAESAKLKNINAAGDEAGGASHVSRAGTDDEVNNAERLTVQLANGSEACALDLIRELEEHKMWNIKEFLKRGRRALSSENSPFYFCNLTDVEKSAEQVELTDKVGIARSPGYDMFTVSGAYRCLLWAAATGRLDGIAGDFKEMIVRAVELWQRAPDGLQIASWMTRLDADPKKFLEGVAKHFIVVCFRSKSADPTTDLLKNHTAIPMKNHTVTPSLKVKGALDTKREVEMLFRRTVEPRVQVSPGASSQASSTTNVMGENAAWRAVTSALGAKFGFEAEP